MFCITHLTPVQPIHQSIHQSIINHHAIMSGPFKVAILDDYQGFAEPTFQKLDSGKFQVTIFRDTLRPYNHHETSQDEKEKLVKRLEPFNIICKF